MKRSFAVESMQEITLLRKKKGMFQTPPKSNEVNLTKEIKKFKKEMGRKSSFDTSDGEAELDRQLDQELARDIAEMQQLEQN